MGHVERRGQGRWRARYRGPDGRERSKTFPRRVDADRFLTTVEADKLRGDWIDPRQGQVTFAQWVDVWRPTIGNLSPSSLARVEGIVGTHLLPRFGRMPLARLSHSEVAVWVADLTTAGLAPATVHKCHQTLSRVLAAAVSEGMVSRNVAANVRLPRVRTEEMRFLAPTEVAHLADVINPRCRALVLVGAYGGLRFGELAGLRRSRIDLAGRVRVEEACVEVAGTLHWGPPKSDAGARTVALPRFVVQELRDHEARFSQPGRDGLVFTAPSGGPLRRSTFRARVWLPGVATARLDGLRVHDLRHTAVALWIAAGANLLEVARRAGHAKSSFTLDQYGHLMSNADGDLADRMQALYGVG